MAMYNTYTNRIRLMAKFTITFVFSCVPLIKLVGCFRVHKQHMPISYVFKYCSCVFTNVYKMFINKSCHAQFCQHALQPNKKHRGINIRHSMYEGLFILPYQITITLSKFNLHVHT